MVTIFGLGFVGLTTALGFAELGHKVFGIEVNQKRMDILKSGKVPFHEPGLEEALHRHLGKNFELTIDVKKAIEMSDYIYYCVGTPYGSDGEADLTYLYQAIDQTLAFMKDDRFRVLVTKSTIPPTTSSEHILPYVEGKGFIIGKQIGLANNPEFLREGHCWEDFMHADRIVLGVGDLRSEEMLRALYRKLDKPIFAVSLNTGEFIKYLSNTLLATLISFSNEMAEVAHVIGDIDIAKAFRILHMDKRWGNASMTSYVYPGCGYGGYCLPKDTNAFCAQAKKKGYEPKILENVIRMNDGMAEQISNRMIDGLNPKDRIGILGLSFKPGSDDVRDTPAAKVIEKLLQKGYHNICAYDPIAMEEYKNCYEHSIEYMRDYDTICKQGDIKRMAILTAWDEFKDIAERFPAENVVDCRYIL